jgi:dipeptidyl aminopeptidase/acylaminoacyl peptidase
MKSLTTAYFLLIAVVSLSQSQQSSPLSISDIMKGNAFIGYQPENIAWSVDGSILYFDWNPTNEPGNSRYSYNVSDKNSSPVKAEKGMRLIYDPLQSKFTDHYQICDGALIWFDKKSKETKRVYHSSAPVNRFFRGSNPSIVYFESNSNLHAYSSKDGSCIQLTQFNKGRRPEKNPTPSQLAATERDLFEHFEIKKKQREWSDQTAKPDFEPGLEIYVDAAAIEQLQIDPTGRFVSYRGSTYPKNEETNVPNYITQSGHTQVQTARPKVGETEPSHVVGIADLEKDTVYMVDFSGLSAIRKKPEYLLDSTTYTVDRKIVMHELQFNPSSPHAVCDVRSYDNKDRWLVLIDLTTGHFSEIDHQHDEAWIGGPGISGWNTEPGTLGWLKDGERIYYQSEKTGYAHLYLYSMKSKSTIQLTKGDWEVHQVTLSTTGDHFYLQTNTTHPGDRNFYRYDITARKMVPLLTRPGFHDVYLSPDEKLIAVRYSFKNKPWEIYLAPMSSPSSLKQITQSQSPAFKSYNWREPEVISFKGNDGKDVFARLYQPTAGKKNGAAVLFVHGAGYLQNAHNYWSTYFREYMFHNLLVDEGFTVLDIDYRASEGYGRDYRTAIYRHMGGRDLQDQLDGKKLLVNKFGIDSNRVGIYGGSYGGFITLMALFTAPKQFACGAALRSVTDWAHYNHEYTSNILNYPETDPEAYRKSSPLYFADGLKDRLLILHGMVDDNVQFQDVVRLNQRLIELGKTNWEMAVYPVESHGFKESSSWTDEYSRIHSLFKETLIIPYSK